MTLYEHPLKNAYIGYVWTPWANTLAYFPFNDDLLDHSWNWVTLSNTSYLSKQALGYKWQFSQGNTWNNIYAKFTDWNAKFISIWYNVISSSWNSGILGLEKYWYVAYNPTHWNSSISWKIVVFANSSRTIWASVAWMSFNAWHHLTIWFDGSKILISKDGEQVTLYNWSGYNFWNGVNIVGGGNNTNLQCLVSEFICESECWSAAEISNYYNQTKSSYWL